MGNHGSLRPLIMKEVVGALKRLVLSFSKLNSSNEYQSPESKDRWILIQQTSYVGYLLQKVLSRPDQTSLFLEEDGLEAIIELYSDCFAGGRGFLSLLSTVLSPQTQRLNYPPASQALTYALKSLAMNDPLKLLKRMIKILRLLLQDLVRQGEELRSAVGRGGKMEEDEEDEEGEGTGGKGKGKASTVHASEVIRAVPDATVVGAEKDVGAEVLNHYARYMKKVLVVDWVVSWMAPVLKPSSSGRSHAAVARAWAALVEKEGKEALRQLRALHHSSLLESVVVGLTEVGSTKGKRGTKFLLRVLREDGAVIRDEMEEGEKVRTLEYGTIIEAYERKMTVLGIMAYRTKYGWVLEERRAMSTRDDRRLVLEVLDVKEETDEEAGEAKGREVLRSLRTGGLACLSRLQSSYKGLLVVIGKAIMAGTMREGRVWEENQQVVEQLVEIIMTSTKKLLVLQEGGEEEEAVAMYISWGVDVLNGVLFEEKKERGGINGYLMMQMHKRQIFPLLWAAVRLVAETALGIAVRKGSGSDGRREAVQRTLLPVLLMIKKVRRAIFNVHV